MLTPAPLSYSVVTADVYASNVASLLCDPHDRVTCSFLGLFVIVCFLGYSRGLALWNDPDS